MCRNTLNYNKMELLELTAETNHGDFSIGYFYTVDEAIKAAIIDKNSSNGIYCTTGRVNYIFDEDIVA